MSDRLKSFTADKLSALVFRLYVAETVEQLDKVSAQLRDGLDTGDRSNVGGPQKITT